MSEVWDLLVVGGGTAGMVAARTAAGFGARVLLVERSRTGGDCLWTGCVPSKALLAAADVAQTARSGGRYGVEVTDVRVDFAGVMRHVRSAIATIEPDDSPAALRAAKVEVRSGSLVFTGPDHGEIDGTPVEFVQAVIATGSEPALPPITGLLGSDPLTSDTVWDLRELPDRLAVIGAGSVGCELGQAFARLGSRVVMVESANRPLAREDPAAAALVEDALRTDGITLHLGTQVMNVARDGVRLADGTGIEFDRLLVATGRRPRTGELGLEHAGVTTGSHGHVQVDEHLRTSNPRIWAAGDVTDNPPFTHTAAAHGAVAATNAILGLRRRADTALQPRVTYTQPEVAAVGVPTGSHRRGLTLREIPHDHVDRAVTEANPAGFTRLLVDRGGHVVGATVVGPHAGELLGEITLAARLGLRTRAIAGTTHPYPTYSVGLWDLAVDDFRARLQQPAAAGIVRMARAARHTYLSGTRRARRR